MVSFTFNLLKVVVLKSFYSDILLSCMCFNCGFAVSANIAVTRITYSLFHFSRCRLLLCVASLYISSTVQVYAVSKSYSSFHNCVAFLQEHIIKCVEI